MTMTTATRFGAFRLSALKTLTGQENEAFEAKITYHGQVVAYVDNSGRGGSHGYHWLDANAKAEFQSLAESLDEDHFESDDSLVWDLIEATKMNRKKCAMFLLPEDGDFWVDGAYRSAPSRFTVDQIRRAHPDARFWDKDSLSFV